MIYRKFSENLGNSSKYSEAIESPIKIEHLNFFSENNDNNNTQTNNKYYTPRSVFYDKYSKRIIYFNTNENELLIYNRTKTSLKKKVKFFFNLKILKAIVDKNLTYLIMLVNPDANNQFIFVFCLSKEIFLIQFKENYNYLLNMFFAESSLFCLVFVDQIKFYTCNLKNDTIKLLTTLDYKKVLINNFYFVKQYMIFLVQKADFSFDIYSLRKNEVELIKSFSKVFYTRRESFRPSIKRGFSNIFNSKSKLLNDQKVEILNFYNKVDNLYKNSQYFLEYIYCNLYLILLSYEDSAIFMMKIKNINKFPKDEEENKIIKLNYLDHNYNSTIQVLDNLLFAHNFSNFTTIIYDIQLKAQNKIVCYAKNILNTFKKDSMYSLRILGGNIEETCKTKNEKGEEEYTKKLFSLDVDLDILFKNNENKNRKKKGNKRNMNNINESELDGMIMITRRNKSKIFFYDLFNKMLLDKTLFHRIDKIKLLLNEFIRQIQKSNSLALDFMSNSSIVNDAMLSIKTIKLTYKKENEKFYLDDKYVMLSTKNTFSQIEVFKSFKNIVLNKENFNKNGFIINDEFITECLFYIFYFCLKLNKNKIEVIKSYYDTILLLFKQIKEEKTMIKFIAYFSYMNNFPFNTKDIAKYLLDNFNSPVIKLQGYQILKNLGAYNELFSYILNKESFYFAMNFLKDLVTENTNVNITKIFLEYLNNCKNRTELKAIINEYIGGND